MTSHVTADQADPVVANLADCPPYSTAKQVAELFHVSLRTVDRWTATGIMRPVRVSPGRGTSRRLFPRSELIRFARGLESPQI